jgi:hypothetical protein
MHGDDKEVNERARETDVIEADIFIVQVRVLP